MSEAKFLDVFKTDYRGVDMISFLGGVDTHFRGVQSCLWVFVDRTKLR